ncbi:MAG: M14 family metallopeptidase [Parabacteroides sp.]
MKREVLYTLKSPFRDDFKIRGFRFGAGEKSVAIVGPMRGDEVQQQFVCSQLVQALIHIEEEGGLIEGHEILIIPSANPFSMNIGTRFWAMDDTDINRMFPGYDKGETTQRIAAALFGQLQGYRLGVQLVSYYLPGRFVPHVRMMETGYQDEQTAGYFGLPYICLRKPLPFDTTLLNYNWQIWDTKAYSVYAGHTTSIQPEEMHLIVRSLLRFLKQSGIIRYKDVRSAYTSEVVQEKDFTLVKAPAAGIFYAVRAVNDEVRKGDVLACILDPYDGSERCRIVSPVDGVLFFAYDRPLAVQNTLLFQIC